MQIVGLSIAFLVLGAAFGFVEWRWPSVRGQRRLRKGVLTDIAYYVFTPTAGKAVTGVFVFVCLLFVAVLFNVPAEPRELRDFAQPDTFISRQPVGLQLIEFLVLADFIGYWTHRAFHTFARLWRIHAVHHSSTQLDWLSSVRVHPLNDAISTALIAVPLLVLGFHRVTIAAFVPFLTLYAIGLHANVSWDFGIVGRVITSPRFHRWHHSSDAAAVNKNFGGFFVLWDRLFGTYYMPQGVAPTRFGVNDQRVPDDFLRQLAYPLRRASKAPGIAPAL